MGCVDENVAGCFLAGTLTEAAAAEVDQHVDGCADCFERLATLARAQLESIAPPVASGDVTQSLPGRHTSVGLRRGQTIGRYVVLDLVGVGAMGSVYSAADPVLRRTIALKLVRPASEANDIVEEATLLARVAHPNVVAVHDVGHYEGSVFLAMDFIEGQTLREWLTTRRRTAEILRVFVFAGRGLAAAHAVGVVHRDFKPDNVLVGDDGRVVVTDFGLAREALPDEPHPIVGTPAYMAPEQLAGHAADPRADQFSFCVALHEALSGSRPGPEVYRGGPAHVRRVLRRGLARAPEERFPSMPALLDALEDAPGKRRRRVGLVVGLAALLVAIGGGHFVREHAKVRACEAVTHRLDGVWDPSRKEAVHAAFRATNTSYAEDTWHVVERKIDAYTQDWVNGQVEACLATRVRREQPSAVLDLRASCYEERLEEMRSVVDVLGTADANLVRSAAEVAGELPPLGPCARTLSIVAPPPSAIAPSVARLRGDLARSRALRDAGRFDDGKRVLDRATAESVALGYRPLEAVALVESGIVQSWRGDKAAADETLIRAVHVADAGGDDASRLRALGQRLYIAGTFFHRGEAVAALDADASATLERLGGEDPRAEEAYRYTAAMTFMTLKNFDRARTDIARSVALTEQVYGPESYDAARTQSGLCLLDGASGDVDGAVTHCRRAMEVFGIALGRSHPDYGLAAQNLGAMMLEKSDDTNGCTYIEEGLAVGRAAFGPDRLQVLAAETGLGGCLVERGEAARAIEMLEGTRERRERTQGVGIGLAYTLTALGRAYLEGGFPERAVAPLERARAIRSEGQSDDDDRGTTAFLLARALWAKSGERDRARKLVEESRSLYAAADSRSAPSPLRAKERADLDRWAREHP